MDNRASRPGRRTDLLGRRDECAMLDGLIADIGRGESRALVLRGEAGIGKTALLEYVVSVAREAWVVRAAGVESEIELAYAGLHELCAPLGDRLSTLPPPQREALEIVFGLRGGEAPDRLLVGLAVLTLFSEASAGRPLLCVVDDAQWLDQSSSLALAFVARRLLAEPVGLVFAVREVGRQLRHLPELEVGGLNYRDAGALLSSSVRFKLDGGVRDRIIAETRGNPLALRELLLGLSAEELAGFATGGLSTSSNRVEESFRRRIAGLPQQTRRLLLIAAAEPLGEPTLVWRAAELQGIDAGAAAPAIEEGLCEFGPRVRFRHPLVRAAAYRAASPNERQEAHTSIAEATDAEADPDRRAWHRALAATGPDDAVADELERSAVRARARGGQAAAAAFLVRSVRLTLDSSTRAERAFAAAESSYLAGAGDDALRLAAVAERGPLDEFQRACVDALRGRVATMQRRTRDAPALLLGAARRLERFDRRAARETYRDAFMAAVYAGRLGAEARVPEVAAAVRSARPSSHPPSVTDELLDAAALLIDSGWAAGAARSRRAVGDFLALPHSPEEELRWLPFAYRLAMYVWDDAACDAISARTLERVRDTGVLALLPMAAAARVGGELFAGDLAAAAALVQEQDTVQEAIGGDPSPGSRIALAAFCGREAEVKQLDEAHTRDAVARGDGQWVLLLHWSTAVLCNGLGRYDEALAAAQLGAADPVGQYVSSWALSELVEAAVRSGRPETATDALRRLAEMARACGTDWILGTEARARALVADRSDAGELYRDAIERLGRTRFRTELARAHLVYGEYLRREKRRIDAREHLHAAHDMYQATGMDAFAERARAELETTGEKLRARTVETRDDLTPAERQIARLAGGGLSNPQIAERLFLSPRTVEWHLHNVFIKLGLRSRRELSGALSSLDAPPFGP